MKIIHKLILGFLVVASLVGLVGYISIKASQKTLQKTIGEDSTLLAVEMLGHIDRSIYNRIETVQEYCRDLIIQKVVAGSNKNKELEKLDDVQAYIDQKDREWTSVPKEEITPFMQELINNELSEKLKEKLKFYEEKYGYKVFGEVFVTNKYGANVAQTGKTSDYYQADEEWWQEAKRNGLYVGDVEYDESADVYSTNICVRIDDGAGKFMGVIKAVLNIEATINTIKEKEEELVEYKLISKDRKIIYSTEKYERLKPFPKELVFYLEEDAQNHQPYFVAECDGAGEGEQLFAHAHSKGYKDYKGLGWILVVECKTKEIFASVAKLEKHIFVMSLSIAILAILIGFFISRSISNPVSKLTIAAAKIGGGNLDTRVEIKANDELGQLAASFNKMAGDLQRTTTSIDNLNQEISERKRAEEEFRTFLLAVDTSSDAIGMSTAEGKHYYQNKAFDDLFGNIGENAKASVYIDEQVGCEVFDTIMAGNKWSGEVKMRGRAGEVLDILLRAYPIKDKAGKILSLVGVHSNITELKQAEKELKHINKQLEASIERANVLAQEVTISNSILNERVKELNCLYSISNITENSENSLEEILQGIVDLIPTGLQYPEIVGARINFEGCEYKTKSYRDTLWKMSSDITFQGKKIGVVEVVYLEERPPIDEGPFPKEEKRLLNEIADRLSLIITRKQTDKMVQATNDFLESIMESITNAIFVIDMGGISTLVSQAGSKITGYEINEMIDKPFSMLFDPVINEELNKEFVKVKVVGDQISQYEAEMIRKDGKKIFVMLNFAPLYEKDKIVSIVGTVEDITNRKELEQQLLQSQKLESIGQLASGIAHEINTPAQYVCDNTRFLQESFNDITSLMKKHNGLLEAAKSGNIPRKMLEDMEKASKELDIEYLLDEIPQAFKQTIEGIERVSELVRAMKEFSRPCVEGKIAIDINKAIQNTITVAHNEWKYVAEIKTEFDPELPMVLCLPREFNQVILNIIVNAAQAIAVDGKENTGTIAVKTLVNDKWVEIRVSDTGTGIPEDIQDKIYDPFFTTKGVGNGTGQGLAIARSIIVDKHDGTITFETEKGKGTTFIIRLPIDSVSN